MHEVEVAIIGAGPIGIELAVALKQAGVPYIHFESGQIGQTISWYPKMTRFFSSPHRIAIAGVPLQTSDQGKATREDYLAYLRGIVLQFDLEIHTYERVTAAEKTDTGFTLHTQRAEACHCYAVKRVVLAVGDMARPRLLHTPGEDLEHVSHYFSDTHKYFRKRLLIVGGKNSAVEAAIRCHHAGAKVSLSYRRDRFDSDRIKYWLLPDILALIRNGDIRFYPQTVPKVITPDHVTLQPIAGIVADPVDIEADFVLLLTGYRMDTTLFDMLGVALGGEDESPQLNAQTMETNAPGVYVAGTAVAGSQQTYRLFIENCHVHVSRIVAAITGQPIDDQDGDDPPHQIPES